MGFSCAEKHAEFTVSVQQIHYMHNIHVCIYIERERETEREREIWAVYGRLSCAQVIVERVFASE